jgi:hypothetical protein
MDINSSSNYIKCPECKNVLDMSFITKSCPNPLCKFNFEGLEVYLNKNDYELRKALLIESKDKTSKEHKLIITAIKHNMEEYLKHFIECKIGHHYNTLYKDFILIFLDDVNILKNVLKSDSMKNKENTVISKNGYKIYWDLYCHLIKIPSNQSIRFFLKTEFTDFYHQYYKEWLLKRNHKK